MSEAKNSASASFADAEASVWLKLFGSPVLWGLVATVGFYLVIPFSPVWQAEIHRYFAGHWIEYTTSALAFVGLAILIKKGFRLSVETAALNWSGWLLGAESSAGDCEIARLLEKNAQSAPKAWIGTHMARRIREACGFLLSRKSATGLDDHLKYIAELAAGDLHSSFSLVRTVTWAVPILGFLGTVIGITDALGNLTPEQLEKSLDSVTGGLQTAFDTTALSLGWSMVIVFTTYFIERKEQAILGGVEDFGSRRLAPLLTESTQPGSALRSAEAKAAEQLLGSTEAVLGAQMRIWQESIDAARQSWSETLQKQQQQFDEALRAGLLDTLQRHAERLAESQAKDSQLAAFDQNLRQWQAGLLEVHGATQSLAGELRSQSELLLKLCDQSHGLAGMQQQLTLNLDAVRQSAAFEETLHTLNAAVHLLTNRVQFKAA